MALNPYDDQIEQMAAQGNPYSALLAREDGDAETRLRIGQQAASDTTPDRAAEARRLADRMNLPVDVVLRNFDAVQKRAQTVETPYAEMLRQTPKLATWLQQDPHNARISADDMDQMGLLDWLLDVPKRAYEQGQAQVAFGQLRAKSLFQDLTADEHQELERLRTGMTYGPSPAQSWFRRAVQGSAEQLPNLIGGLSSGVKYAGAGAATTGAAGAGYGALADGVGAVPGAIAGAGYGARAGFLYGGAKFGFQMEAGLAYDEYLGFKDELGRPLDPQVAKAAAIATGAVNAGLEAYGLEKLASTVPGLKALTGAATRNVIKQALKSSTVRAALGSMMKEYGSTLAAETATEVAQRAVTILSGELAKAEHNATGDGEIAHRSAKDIVADLWNEGAGALESFALLVAPGPGMTFAHEAVQARHAQQNAAFFTALGEGVTNSKTAQRLPEAAQEFIAQATKDGPLETVYAPVDTFTTYWQSKGVDPAAMAAQLTGKADALDQARATGEDLAIPTAAYAVQLAPTEHNAFFSQELRLRPDQMNTREATAFAEQLSEVGHVDPAAADALPATSAVRESVQAQLEAAGVERSAAEAQATLYDSVFQTLGQRAGVDPAELFARYGLQIGRTDLDTTATQGETVADESAAGEGTRVEGGAASGGVASSPARVYADDRTREHFDTILVDLVEHARALDPSVTVDDLRPEFESRLALLDDLRAADRDSGRNPKDLLQAIAKAGGIGPESEGGLTGELKSLKEGTRFGALQGVRGVFRKRTLDDKGMPATGLGFDVMVQRLQQDPRFSWIENVDMLIDALDDITRNPLADDSLPTADELARTLGMRPGDVWWKPTTYEQGAAQLFDTLDTGEEQARLPGDAGAVRDVEKPTPQIDAPFALTSEVEKPSKRVQQTTLFQALFQAKRAPRGSFTIGPDRQASINLFKDADLSTFLHESGHFYLEVVGDLVDGLMQADPSTLTDSQKQMLGDYAALLEWMGVESRDQIGVDQHEQFARGFEAYLMEGKAPTSALRQVFARFRAWLVGVYRSLTSLNVELTDDVRRVFDRLVASDDAIAQAEAEGQIAPLFLDPATAGMSADEFERYRGTVEAASIEARDALAGKVLRELQREQKAWWKAERETLRTMVAGEIHQQPVYRALAAMRKGTHPDGTALVDGETPTPLKLSKAMLVDRYTPEQIKALRDRQLYSADGGLSPDAVAEIFGFSSGDELVQSVLAAPAMKATIEAETDARMRQKFGDLALDGRLPEAAQQAVFGAGRQRVIEAELSALAKGMAEGTIPPAALLRSAAESRIAGMAVRDIKPGLFLMAAQRASRRAFDLLQTNADRVGAVEAKHQELFNLALYREAVRVREDVEKRQRWILKADNGKARARLGKAGDSYLDQWDGFLDRYEFKRVSQKVIDRRASLADWVAAQEAEGLPVDLPAAVLNDARRVNYQSLTVEEFQGVTDAMKQIVHLARLKNKLLTAADQRDFESAIADVVASIRTHTPAKPLPLEFLPKELKARRVAEWFASHSKIATLARAMDGYEDGGAVWERVIRPINEAGTREAAMNAEATKALHALITTAYTGRELAKLHDTTFIPAINGSLSKEARLVAALNYGSEGNRQRLSDGRGWNDEQVRAIVDTLDERDWTFVQGVWDCINTYWPQIVEKQKRVTGIAPAKVEASPVQTKFGEFRGGYFPAVYDGRLSARAGSFIDANEATLQKQAAYVKATTRRGFTEARAKANNEPMRLELSVLYGHVEAVIHDLSHHEMLIDVGRVLGDRRVQQAIYETHGDIVYGQFKNALKDIAFGTRPASGSIERALNFMRQGTTVAGLAWNVWTAVQQPVGVFNGMARVGPQWVLKGMGHMLRDAASMENTAAWIYDRSEMMRLRGLTSQREVSELRNTVSHPGGWFDNVLRTTTADKLTQQDIADSYFALIAMAQRLADMPTWIGAYEKAMAGGEEESRAIALADQAVLDAQGGGQIKDLAEAQRGTAAAKLFTNFYSYGSLLYNQTSEAYGKTNFRRPGSVGQFLVNLSLLYVFPAAASLALAKAFGRGDDDESWIFSMGKEIVGQALNTMVLVRELGGFLNASNRGYDGPAGTRVIATAYQLGTQLEQGDADRGLLRAAEDAGAILFHLPLAQVQRSVDGAVALQQGKTQNPLALVAGAPREAR